MPSKGKRGWFGLLLFVSIALNLFLGGVMLGRATFSPLKWDEAALEVTSPDWHGNGENAASGNGPAGGQLRTPSTENRLAERVRALPPAERRRFVAALWQNRGELVQARQELRRAVRHVAQVIGAPQLDQQALSAALSDVRTATTREQEALHTALGPALATLSPESRAMLASWGPAKKQPSRP